MKNALRLWAVLTALSTALLMGSLLAAKAQQPVLNSTPMRKDASNAILPTARNNLLLTSEGYGASVIDQGADNTGTNDVSAVLQTMVNSGTHALSIPAGIYKFSDIVALPVGTTTVQCEIGKTTLIASAGHTAKSLFFGGAAGGSLIMRGCKLDGNMANVGVDNCFIQTISPAADVLFEFNTFTNNRGPILCLSSTTRPTVRLNHFTNVGWWFANGGPNTINVAITCNQGSTHPHINGNVVDTIGGDFLDSSCNDTQFIGNDVYGTNQGYVSPSTNGGQSAVYMFLGAVGGTIVGNSVYGLTGNAFDIHCAHHVTITGNTGKHSSGAGIALSGAPAGDTATCNSGGAADSISYIEVSGNTLLDNGQSSLGRTTIASVTTVIGSPTLTMASTTGVVDNTPIAGTGIPVNTFVLSHTGTTVTMTRNATANGTISVIFGWVSPGINIQSAVWIGCSGSATACTADHVDIGLNLAADTQITKTQRYGVVVDTAYTVTLTDSKFACGEYDANLTGRSNVALDGCTTDVRAISSGSSDTATIDDLTVAWNSNSGLAKAQTIPGCTSLLRGKMMTITDQFGDAATHNITITPASGTIAGSATSVISANQGTVRAQCDGGSNWLVL